MVPWMAFYAPIVPIVGIVPLVLPSATDSELRYVARAGSAELLLYAEVQPLWFAPEAPERASGIDREVPRPGESAPRVSWPYPCPVGLAGIAGEICHGKRVCVFARHRPVSFISAANPWMRRGWVRGDKETPEGSLRLCMSPLPWVSS